MLKFDVLNVLVLCLNGKIIVYCRNLCGVKMMGYGIGSLWLVNYIGVIMVFK